MDVQTLRRLRTQLLTEAEQITQAKQPGYIMGRADALSNFKTVAERMGITPMQAWGIYFLKHVDSISAYAKDPKIPQGEALIGRFADAINYLCLGWALYYDSKQAANPFEVPSTVYWDEERKGGGGLKAQKIDYTGFDEAAKTGAPIEILSWGDERWSSGHPVPDGDGVQKDGRFDWHLNPSYGESRSNEPRYNLKWRRLTPFGWIYSVDGIEGSVPRDEDDGA